jgi:hypothetical protein
VLGCSAAAASDKVDKVGDCKVPQVCSHRLRTLVVPPKCVWQSCNLEIVWQSCILEINYVVNLLWCEK